MKYPPKSNVVCKSRNIRMKEKIWKYLASQKVSDFFITAEIRMEDSYFPVTLESFIHQKTNDIYQKGIKTRKFSFKEGKWKMILTFFPTDEVVDEKYALKNFFLKRQKV